MPTNAAENHANRGSCVCRQERRKQSATVAQPIVSAPQMNVRMRRLSVPVPDESVQDGGECQQRDARAQREQVGVRHDVEIDHQQCTVQCQPCKAQRAPEEQACAILPATPQQQARTRSR